VVCPEPGPAVDLEEAVGLARGLWETMYPDEPFLPRVPSPEETKWDVEEEHSVESASG